MTRRVAMRYRGAEGLACPLCAAEGKWTQLANVGFVPRVDHRVPEGVTYEPLVLKKKGRRRLYPDDVPVAIVVGRDGYDGRTGRGWEHHYSLMCGIHPVAYNRAEATPHAFAEDELPADYWAREVGTDGAME